MTGFQRTATMVAMYRTERSSARPPQTWWVPRKRPLSRLKGATPASAAILTPVELPELRQLSKQRAREHRPYAGHAAQQFLLGTPPGARPQQLIEIKSSLAPFFFRSR
jgi:hypothetical protein